MFSADESVTIKFAPTCLYTKQEAKINDRNLLKTLINKQLADMIQEYIFKTLL